MSRTLSYPGKEDAVQRVKDATDILEIIGENVSLKKAGVNYKGLCPFHAEKTPSFTVNPQRGSFHCFGCNEGGDVFSFYMKYHNVTFPEALQTLARRYNITLPEASLSHRDQARARQKTGILELLDRAATLYQQQLLNGETGAQARQYLAQREIPPEIGRTFRLGYAPDSWDYLTRQLTDPKELELAAEAGLIVKKDRGGYYDRFRNRLLCPIFNLAGQVAGFSGRILGEGQPKYLNSPESPVFDKSRLLFGLFQNREAIRHRGRCLLVEGNFDLLALNAKGVGYGAAPLGTALTNRQVRALKGYAEEVIILFDGDNAGLKAAMRAVPIFLAEEVIARVFRLPADHDPDSYVCLFGPEKLEEDLAGAIPLTDFVYTTLVERYGSGLEGKTRIGAELRTMLSGLAGHQMQHSVFVSHFSKKLGISPEQLLSGKLISSRQPSTQSSPPREKELPLKQKQLLEFLIIFPEYLQKFLEAGIEIMITTTFGCSILRHLREVDRLENGKQERLLELATGPEKTFISRLLTTTPVYSADEREQTANEQLDWLRKSNSRIMHERLTKQINEAQKSGDVERCLQLIGQKKALDRNSCKPLCGPDSIHAGEKP